MNTRISRFFFAMMLLSLLLAACGGRVTPTSEPAAGSETKTEESKTEAESVTSSGYVCPKPEPKMEVTSKEFNHIFVWTEYIPVDWKECFEIIYGVRINTEEYSAC